MVDSMVENQEPARGWGDSLATSCLLYKCKDPTRNPRTHIKKPDLALYSCNPSFGEAERQEDA